MKKGLWVKNLHRTDIYGGKKMKGMSNNGTHAKCQCMETKGVCVKLNINRMCLNFERSQKELG